MRIAFLVHRNIYYKYFATIIDEALKRGHEIFCLHDYSQSRTGAKGYQFASLEEAPGFKFGKVNAISFNNDAELLRIVQEHSIQVLLTIHFLPQYLELRNQLKKQGVFWVSIQAVGDMLGNTEFLHMPDRYLLYSEMWLSLALHFLTIKGIENVGKLKNELDGKVQIAGFPEVDQTSMISASSVRNEWGIPEGKPVVLFLPFPLNASNRSFWVSYIYGKNNMLLQLPLSFLSFRARYIKQAINGWNDQNLVKALRKFCDRNNAYLLVKSRKKDPVRPYLFRVADKVLYDEEFYPSTIMKCMKIADLCCNFYSSAVLEASAVGVPNICIAPSARDWLNLRVPLWKMLFEQANDMYDFPGVSYKLSIAEAIKAFSEKSFSDFSLNSAKQNLYVQKFVGPAGDSYSSNSVTEIENLVNSKYSA